MDGEAVPVGAEREAGEVDVDAGGPVAPRPEPVRPRSEQGKPQGLASSKCRQATGEREVLAASPAEGDAGHPEVREERGREVSGREDDGGLPPEATVVDRCGRDAQGTSMEVIGAGAGTLVIIHSG